MSSLWWLYRAGSTPLWLLSFWLLCVMTVIGERLETLFVASIDRRRFLAALARHTAVGDMDGAVRLCSVARAALARIATAALASAHGSDDEIRISVYSSTLVEKSRIRRRTDYLKTFGSLAMLSGLWGTFGCLGSAAYGCCTACCDPSAKVRILAQSISESLCTTAYGLAVAILALLGFAFLKHATAKLEDALDEAAPEVCRLVANGRAIR